MEADRELEGMYYASGCNVGATKEAIVGEGFSGEDGNVLEAWEDSKCRSCSPTL